MTINQLLIIESAGSEDFSWERHFLPTDGIGNEH